MFPAAWECEHADTRLTGMRHRLAAEESWQMGACPARASTLTRRDGTKRDGSAWPWQIAVPGDPVAFLEHELAARDPEAQITWTRDGDQERLEITGELPLIGSTKDDAALAFIRGRNWLR